MSRVIRVVADGHVLLRIVLGHQDDRGGVLRVGLPHGRSLIPERIEAWGPLLFDRHLAVSVINVASDFPSQNQQAQR